MAIDDLRLQPKQMTAVEIAVLVKCLPNIAMAADLIEQYARSEASKARIEASIEFYDRVNTTLNGTG